MIPPQSETYRRCSVRPFRFGLISETPLPPAGLAGHARRIEAGGFSTFLIRDHFVPDYFGPQLGPITTMTAVAMVTSSLRVGSLVFNNDYRHPVLLAKEAATIDVLSGGRLELGLGAGWQRREYESADLPYDRNGVRISRLEEGIRVIKRLFLEPAVTFAGDHYRLQALEGFPKPVQAPHSPILIGAGKPRMLRLAGREADIVNILSTSVATGALEDDPRERLPESVDAKLGWIREGAGDRFDGLELSMVPAVIVTNRRREGTLELIASRGWQGITPEEVWSMPSVLIGSIDQIVQDLEARRQRFRLSYVVFSDRQLEEVQPIVRRLGNG